MNLNQIKFEYSEFLTKNEQKLRFLRQNRPKNDVFGPKSDTFTRVLKVLESLSYKPGSYFKAYDYLYSIAIYVYLPVTDSRDGHKDELQAGRELSKHILNKFCDEEIVDYIRNNVLRFAELHEMDEWIRFKGELIYDPHK